MPRNMLDLDSSTRAVKSRRIHPANRVLRKNTRPRDWAG